MRNPRQNTIRLATAAAIALSGIAIAPTTASANDVIGEITHTLTCWEKLVTNASDRVEVCNPVLHKSSFSSPTPAPKPEPDPCYNARILIDTCCNVGKSSFSIFAEVEPDYPDYPCAQ